MKMEIDTKKGAEAVTEAIRKASDFGKKVAVGVQAGAKEITDRAKDESYIRRKKKYNPIFKEQYESSEFNVPNMIVIVDDAVRRGIDVCEGAMGWLSNQGGTEVLFLYDEDVEFSGIRFIPTATCDAVYYVDNFDRNNFININNLFERAHDERMAELVHIAYSLGAKRCSIELSESSSESGVKKKKLEIGEALKIKASNAHSKEESESNLAHKEKSQRRGKITVEFSGSDIVKKPDLKWFKHNETIKKLIDMRCEDTNSIKTKTLFLEGSSFATMSQKTAYAIDNAISKMEIKGSMNMQQQATKEQHSKLIFEIEF